MLNKEQSVQISLLFMIIITLNMLFFVGNMISVQATTGTSSATGSNGRSISNGTSIADQEESRLMNELVKTGKFTKDEAREFVTKVMLMNELVKTGKFTKDEAREFVTKVMKNGTDGTNVTAGSNVPVPEANLSANVPVPEANLSANVPVPEANLSANVPVPEANLSANVPVPEANLSANVPVPEANLSANVPVPEANLSANVPVPEANLSANVPVPEANLSANVPVPEANLSANVPVPEANLSANVPVPEANLSANVPVPEANIPQNNNSGLVKLDIGVKQNPIAPGEEQTVILTASDPITGEPIDRIFVHLTIKGPSGNIVKDYTDNDGKLSPTFVIGENDVGTFTILGTALQAGVESRKSLTFQVQ